MSIKEWAEKHCPFLFDNQSLFYYFLSVLLIGFLWMGYAIFTNGFAVLYGWDYSSQYVTMSYHFHDVWRGFLKTGYFDLYSSETYLGADNIGSNSYYGLFDPFLVPFVIFPRSWMPQIYVMSAMLKGVASALSMRLYLKYMGVKEGSARLGGIAYAFSGYINFMVGFPTYLSMAFTLPLILLGIEQTIKERRIHYLVFGFFFLGIISFFFLVVFAIFGVLYAGWRFFQTVKTRRWHLSFSVLGLGVLAFSLGILMSAWTLFPSVRESALSGRTTSIGTAYLNSIIKAFGDKDFGAVFALLFQPVGLNMGRELQGLIGFFYPTCNYLWLPLAKSPSSYSYDSWTASLFCYTPYVILFFMAFLSSIRRKKWSHILAIALCSYLLFTNFAYFMFFAFAGDGYGRWYIVLVPLIIYYGSKELDRIKEEPRWVAPSGSALALFMTVMTYVTVVHVLKNGDFYYVFLDGYGKDEYQVPASVVLNGVTSSLAWIIYYQIALVLIVSFLINWDKLRDKLPRVLFFVAATEIVISGNLSFFYGYMTPLGSYNHGPAYISEASRTFDRIESFDGTSFYRAYSDAQPDKNTQMAFGYNGSGMFHSLFNYDLVDFTRYSYMTNNESTHEAYGEDIVNKSWAGFYGNKRYAMDIALGEKYYVIEDEGYGAGYDNWPANVPFGSELLFKEGRFRVYESSYVDSLPLGHAVSNVYLEGRKEVSTTMNASDFFHNFGGTSATKEILRNENVYLNGAIVKDEDAEKLLDDLNSNGGTYEYSEVPDIGLTTNGYEEKRFKSRYVETVHGNGVNYGYYAYNEEKGINWGPEYFLTHLDDVNVVAKAKEYTVAEPIVRDFGKLVHYPSAGWGQSFNPDSQGAYFLLDFASNGSSFEEAPRIYVVGDKLDADGNVIEENALLSYEWSMLDNWIKCRVNSWSGSFGMYVPGRAKCFVICYKGSGSVNPIGFRLYMKNQEDIELELANLESKALLDVETKNDTHTFKTDFSERSLVVTQLGYDKGWKVKATSEEGEHVYPDVYKLNGGLVGFVAPQGQWDYVLSYETPFLYEGSIIAMLSFSSFALYGLAHFAYDIRKEMKKEGLTLSFHNPFKAK